MEHKLRFKCTLLDKGRGRLRQMYLLAAVLSPWNPFFINSNRLPSFIYYLQRKKREKEKRYKNMGYKNGSSAKKKCFFLLEVARLLIKTFIMNSTLASNLTLQNRTEKKPERKKAFVKRTHCTVDLQTTKMWLFIDFFLSLHSRSKI